MLSEQLSKEVLEQYLKTREAIEQPLQQLLTFTSLLSQYKDCAGDEVWVEIAAIGEVNVMLNAQLHLITESLEGFLPLWEVMAVLDGQEDEG